jgi:hypothetical protein
VRYFRAAKGLERPCQERPKDHRRYGPKLLLPLNIGTTMNVYGIDHRRDANDRSQEEFSEKPTNYDWYSIHKVVDNSVDTTEQCKRKDLTGWARQIEPSLEQQNCEMILADLLGRRIRRGLPLPVQNSQMHSDRGMLPYPPPSSSSTPPPDLQRSNSPPAWHLTGTCG